MKLNLLVMLMLLHPISVHAEDIWLVVGASDPTPAGIAQKWKARGMSSGIVVKSSDCGDSKNVFAWVPRFETSVERARNSLQAVKRSLQDAYIKRCRVRPRSLLAFRETAVDFSIADVPATAVNWDDADRVTTIHTLKGTWHIVISRYYEGSIEDSLEGRRERVILVGHGGERHSLQQCVQPEKFTTDEGILAFQCTVAQAGDELLHNVVVYTMGGQKAKEVMHCRNPTFRGERTIACESEAVGADGVLKLQKVARNF